MKKTFDINPAFICFSFLISIASHSQDLSASTQPKKNYAGKTDYLKKSKKQKTTGLVLLGSGAVCFGAGVYALEHAREKNGSGAIIMLGGMGMAAASLPLFISSAVTKRKAKISMKREAFMITPLQQSNISYNSISLRLNL